MFMWRKVVGGICGGRRVVEERRGGRRVANDQYPIYKENTREYVLLHTERLGTLVQMEVGALLVGKIINHARGSRVRRGWEKGRFAFGGSTVILMTEKGAVCPDRDILENSGRGMETKVKLGERVGAGNT